MQVATSLTSHGRFLSLTTPAITTFLQSTTAHFTHSAKNNCSNEPDQEIPSTNYILGIFLSLFCFITVVGNGLVIYAIVQERYLKSATYYYMASLACADLIVGLIVMPFGIVLIVRSDNWPFGRALCDLWHSIDVFASTASILDLCVIALDRYSAITNPISYHQTFFVKRWPYLLVAVWLCSALISFPAVAYWRHVAGQYQPNRCKFPEDISYTVFSSLISFYIPLFVMIFVYIRIYRAAIKQMHAFKTGVKVASPTTKKKKKGLKNTDTPVNAPPDVCLRIHRGKYHGIPSVTRDSSSTINNNEPARSSNPEEHLTLPKRKLSNSQIKKSISGALLTDHQNASLSRFSMPALNAPANTTTTNDHHQLTIVNSTPKKGPSQDTLSTYGTPRPSKTSPTNNTSTGTSLGKRLTKFSKEQKATITLAYVMGIFVICWLPFFVYNPLTAIAKKIIGSPNSTQDCTVGSSEPTESFITGNSLVFDIFTWFGYINSSVNPIIYAYSSREFRRAFIKYLCRCFPMRIRNLMMSYHNLHLLRYRRAPESNLSKENNESGSDHNHHINHHHHHHHPHNSNKQHMLPSSPSTTTTMILTNIQNRTTATQYKHSPPRRQTKDKNKHSRMHFFSHCCRTNPIEQQGNKHDKRSSSSTSSKATISNNILVDYCTYHDVAVSRVTCV